MHQRRLRLDHKEHVNVRKVRHQFPVWRGPYVRILIAYRSTQAKWSGGAPNNRRGSFFLPPPTYRGRSGTPVAGSAAIEGPDARDRWTEESCPPVTYVTGANHPAVLRCVGIYIPA
jgi:hypothetical protein